MKYIYCKNIILILIYQRQIDSVLMYRGDNPKMDPSYAYRYLQFTQVLDTTKNCWRGVITRRLGIHPK